MVQRKLVATIFILIALSLGTVFYYDINFPIGYDGYFNKDYYGQFGPLAICVELFIAGYYVFKKHSKANFTLALFGFTVLLDIFFNLIGLFSSNIPLYANIIFVLCAITSLWMSFANVFDLGKISFWGALWSFILGNLVELFFNYL